MNVQLIIFYPQNIYYTALITILRYKQIRHDKKHTEHCLLENVEIKHMVEKILNLFLETRFIKLNVTTVYIIIYMYKINT